MEACSLDDQHRLFDFAEGQSGIGLDDDLPVGALLRRLLDPVREFLKAHECVFDPDLAAPLDGNQDLPAVVGSLSLLL